MKKQFQKGENQYCCDTLYNMKGGSPSCPKINNNW